MIPGLKPNGKCRYYKAIPEKIKDAYLCTGGGHFEPCPDIETCKEKQEAEKEHLNQERQDS